MKTRKYIAVFNGNTTSVVTVKEEYDGYNLTFYFRVKRFLFFESWVPVYSDLNKLMSMYTEKPIFDVANNRTTERLVRIFPFGLSDMKVIQDMKINMEAQRELETLRASENFWYNAFVDFKTYIEESVNIDSVRARMKDEFDFVDKKLKPEQMNSMAQKLAELSHRRRS